MVSVYVNPHRVDAAAAAAAQDSSSRSALDLVLLRVRLRARRRAAWLTHLWCDTGSPLEGNLQACLDDRDTPEAEAAWCEQSEIVQPWTRQLESVERVLAGEAGAGLQQLGRLFGLSEQDLDLLQTCLALAIDPTLGPVYAYLQQHPGRSYVTDTLVARLFGYGRRSIWNPGCPLAIWGLVSAGEADSGEPYPLMIDPLVVDWLHGELRIDAALLGRMHLVEPRAPLEGWPVENTAQVMQRVIERESAVRVLLVGPPASGRRTLAATVAARFGIQTLCIDTGGIADPDWPDSFMRTQRSAVLGGTALVWFGDGLDRKWPGNVSPAPFQFMACDPNQVVPPCEHVIDHRIDMSSPTLAERHRLWRSSVPASAAWPTKEFETLVARYRLNAGDIVSVAQQVPTSAREASAIARELTRHRLGDLGQLLDCPFTWDDLVVPDKLCEALEDFAFEARDRSTFWESPNARRLFPRGTGLVGLFGGPPGTGKTMAAQVIAADLELDLFRIDLATTVSKYIGETAKHLGQIFARAARMNAVLLFDEADALFSKRTEVKDSHDRYANADTSYLLQLLEEYRGIVILASNKRQNIDPAFIRRVRYVFEFPRPDVGERRRIWRQVIGELSGHETLKRLEATIEALAATVEMTGAQIKNAVLASIFIARRSREPMAMAHLLRGVERELSKEGRSVGSRERERLMRDG